MIKNIKLFNFVIIAAQSYLFDFLRRYLIQKMRSK